MRQLNDKLAAIAQCLFKKTLKSGPSDLRTLSSFGEVVTGKTPPTARLEFYGQEVPFIKTPDMHNSVFVIETESYLSETGAKSQANKFIPERTVLTACIGANAGEVAISSVRAQTNQQINSLISQYPCFLYLSILENRDGLRALGEGSSTMININKTSFEHYKIVCPETTWLNQLEGHLSKIFNQIEACEKEIDNLTKLKALFCCNLSS